MGVQNSQPAREPMMITIDDGPDLESAVAAFAGRENPAVLESVAGDPIWGRWSVLACDPLEVLVLGQDHRGDPFEALANRLARYPAMENPTGLPFAGGWIGYISYEAGARVEHVYPTNPAGTSLPLVRMALYDTVAVHDQGARRWHLVAVDWPGHAGIHRPGPEERLAQLSRLLRSPASLEAPVTPPAPGAAEMSEIRGSRAPRPDRTGDGAPAPDWTREEYFARVRAAKQYIAAGDIYQVNLTQRFAARRRATPSQIYLDLRRTNPADYAALLAWGDCAVISSSPELFLDLHGKRLITRPIKGSRPRAGDARLDAIRRRELADSEKDRAELNMIIDLLRNDIGRVCEAGSVRVESAGDLESHPTVHHRVATITGRLGADHDAIGLLRATSPGGSITGAPKIRAMQIIDELESVQRGVYCGSIGYLGLDGNMTMNIAIRTMILDHGRLHIHAGGAIVADSDPEEEYDETLAKAAGMFRALEAGSDRLRRPDVPSACAGPKARR